jgi:ribosomal protein S18 acetylase RimI-like enzyme
MEIKRINSAERHLVADLFNQYRVYYEQPSNIALADEYLKERLENNESVVFIALLEENGTSLPIGFTQLYPTYSSVRATKNWILNDLFVHPEYRNLGAGQKLIRTVMQFAKETGATFVQLETGIDNIHAQRLYETIGFTRQAPDADFYVYRIAI